MGHLLEKYTTAYFLGGTDRISQQTYGVLGHEEYKKGGIDERHRSEFVLTLSLADGVRDKDILDIGVGRGDHVPLFLKEGIRSFYGIDFAPASIALARQHVTDARARFDILEAKDIAEGDVYDVITMFDVIEHIPVFEMEVVWRKIKQILRPGGVVALSTPIFQSPNVADHSDRNPSVMGVHCHKQTLGTLLRTCAQYGFVVAHRAERFFGLVRRDDLACFSEERRARFLDNHRQLCSEAGLDTDGPKLSETENALLVPPPGRLLIGCVAENSPKYLAQAVRLVQSIRWFGGAIAGANVFVCVVDGVESAWEEELQRWGAFVRVVPRFSDVHAQSNKLRLLEVSELGCYDTITLMDCDTIVVQDPSPFLNAGVFRAKIADCATVPHQTFKALFDHYRIELPAPKYRCTTTNESTIWYCNAGVLIFPRPLLQVIYPVWRSYTLDLTQHIDLLGKSANFCEQASLTVAYHASPVPFCELPVAMNFPLHQSGRGARKDLKKQDPIIVHYHHLTDPSGFLQKTHHRLAQARVEAFNQRVREYRKRAFDNRLFWDMRYSNHPELGLGVGSRGLSRIYKRQILKQIVERLKPGTILDIGCGDGYTASELPDKGYLGVDISQVAISANRVRHPKRQYVAGDFLKMELDRFDLTICLDVLIHQDNPESFRKFIERVVSRTGFHGIIAGFEALPRAKSEITFYHEALSSALKRAGIKNLRRLGRYREVTLWLFSKGDAAPECAAILNAPGGGCESGQHALVGPRALWRRGVARLQANVLTYFPFFRRRQIRFSLRSLADDVRSSEPECSDLEIGTPTFVVGCIRSGTTVLAQLLGRYPDIVYCPFELKQIWSRVGGVPMASPKTGDRNCPQLGSMDACPATALRLSHAFVDEYCKNFVRKNPGARFLSKNPHLCNKLPFVDRLFANEARFIWIFRDLPSVVFSVQRLFASISEKRRLWHYWPKKLRDDEIRCWQCFNDSERPANLDPARFFPGGDVQYLAEYWLETNRAVSEFCRIHPGRTLAVREEELVLQPDEVIARILAFLEVPLDVSILAGRELDAGRNSVWIEGMEETDRARLLSFVREHRDQVDGIFPVENLALSYETILRQPNASQTSSLV